MGLAGETKGRQKEIQETKDERKASKRGGESGGWRAREKTVGRRAVQEKFSYFWFNRVNILYAACYTLFRLLRFPFIG